MAHFFSLDFDKLKQTRQSHEVLPDDLLIRAEGGDMICCATHHHLLGGFYHEAMLSEGLSSS